MSRKVKSLLFAFILIAGLICCLPIGNATIHLFGTPVVVSAYSDLNTHDLYITKGDSYQLKLKNAKGKVKWYSEDPSIASVTSKGLVKAKKRGSTSITCVDKTAINTCYITVETPKISKSKITLIKGSSYDLSVKGTYRRVKWTTADKNIAKVSKYGTVTAKKAGTVDILAQVGNHKYTCKVKVETPKLSAKELYLEPGKQSKLTLSGTTKKVSWSTGDKKIATVSSDGTVTAKKQGYTTITAKVGSMEYECEVNVEKPYLSDTSMILIKGDWEEIEVKDTLQDQKWSSSNNNVATVSEYGSIVAVNVGRCVITCDLGYKKLTCNILVENPSLSAKELTLIEGQSYQLTVSGTTQKVVWSSSKSSVATVSANGLVTAKEPGYAEIYAKVGSEEYTCEVEVNDEPVNLNQIEKTYYDTGRGIVGIFKNNYRKAINIEMTVLYYDSKGSLIDQRSDSISALKTGCEAAIKVSQPYDDNTWDDLAYSSYNVKLSVEKAYHENSKLGNEYIRMEDTNTGSKVIVKYTNTSSNEYDSIEAAIVFFDSNGHCIGYDYAYPDCETAGKTDYVTFDYPVNRNTYESITPASYRLFLNHAY